MAITEENRHQLYQRLENVLGHDEATWLMEHLPPLGWADVATKRDLDQLAAATKRDISDLAAATKGDISDLAAATKRDISDLAAATKRDISDLAAATKRDLDVFAERFERRLAEFKADLVQSQHRLTVTLFTAMTTGWFALGGLIIART